MRGARGEPGVVGAYLRSSVVLAIPDGSDGSTFASCDIGDIATGGGFSSDDGLESLDIHEARPVDAADALSVPSSYHVKATNNTSVTKDLQVWVVCLDITP